MTFLQGALFITQFQRDTIVKISKQEPPCTSCKGKKSVTITMADKTEMEINCGRCSGSGVDPKALKMLQETVQSMTVLTEISWLAAQDAVKEQEHGNNSGSSPSHASTDLENGERARVPAD